MSDRRRVVITGLGAVSAYGFGEQVIWDNMIAGKTGISTISHIDTSCFKTTVGGTVDREALQTELSALRLRYTDMTVSAGIFAADQALKQAGLIGDAPPYEHQEIATLIGTGIGSVESYYAAVQSYIEKGLKGVRPTTVPRCMANAVCSQIAIRYRLTGPNYVMTSACTSSTTAIGVGFRMIKDGYIDTALCGGADTVFEPLTMAAWDRLGIMSKDPNPITCCRPFDRDRDGCVIGEGAAALVLESLDSALARGATIRAEVCGYGESSDAMHITSPDAPGQARAIRAAVDSAGINADEIGYISAHGTATKANDPSECAAVKLALGAAAADIPMGSSKSYFGHLLGGSGAIETLATVLMLEHRELPANLNLDNPDDACDACLVGNVAQPLTKPVALKNSFGFGGNNGVLVLRSWND
jgi:3-oxoacyl-[acyl-carrier-protein] synthase II